MSRTCNCECDYEDLLQHEAYLDYLDHRAYLDYLQDLVQAPAYAEDAPEGSRILLQIVLLCSPILLVLVVSWFRHRSAQRVPAPPSPGADLRRRSKSGGRWQQASQFSAAGGLM